MKRGAITRIFWMMFFLQAFCGKLQAEDRPVLTYTWSGGFSPYQEIRITIRQSHSVLVQWQKYNEPPNVYETRLRGEEFDALLAALEASDFFNQPLKDDPSVWVTDVGETQISINLNGRSRSLTYRYRPGMHLLAEYLGRLRCQAIALDAIRNDDDIYSAVGAVNIHHAGLKALQPYCFKEPLKDYILTHADRQRITWTLEALAFVTSSTEFSGFVESALHDHAQREKLLGIIGTHPFYGNIPVSHLQGLCPIYSRIAERVIDPMLEASAVETEVCDSFIRVMGIARYRPSIPMLIKDFENHRKRGMCASSLALSRMGVDGLNVLLPYLESPESCYRVNAIELFTYASETGPHCGFSNPLPQIEYDRMIPVLNDTIIPKLMALSQDDPDEAVRSKAAYAISWIQKWIAKEVSASNEGN